jgi:hypothetical protein
MGPSGGTTDWPASAGRAPNRLMASVPCAACRSAIRSRPVAGAQHGPRIGLALLPLTLVYASTRTVFGLGDHVALPAIRVLAIGVALVSYPWLWEQVAAIVNQLTKAVLSAPLVGAACDRQRSQRGRAAADRQLASRATNAVSDASSTTDFAALEPDRVGRDDRGGYVPGFTFGRRYRDGERSPTVRGEHITVRSRWRTALRGAMINAGRQGHRGAPHRGAHHGLPSRVRHRRS